MRRSIWMAIFFIGIIAGCKNYKQDTNASLKNNWIMLRSDTMNLVRISDTMIIIESACRGCVYEATTSFSISDSMGMLELSHIETLDHNSPEMAGGSISKNLILVPKKNGKTVIKVYKFLRQPINKEDSSNCTNYSIEVKN